MIRDRREPLKLKRNDPTKDLTLPKEGMDARLGNERMVACLEEEDDYSCYWT